MTVFRPHTQDSLYKDRSLQDRSRHKQLLKESIRENLPDILSEESIIGKSGDKLIKIPLRSIKEYRFVFGDNNPAVGSGDGDTEQGQMLGNESEGNGKAGNNAGVDAIETEMTVDELIQYMFEDLGLPDLRQKSLKELETISQRRKGNSKKGIRARLDRKLTAKNRIKREIASGEGEPLPIRHTPERFPYHKDDLRYKRITSDERQSSNAVIMCIMDTSGSMGTVKKYLARSFYYLLYHFIKTKYQNTEIVFIAHHTEAKVVNEEEFFHKVESGGTYISSGYKAALDLIETKYSPQAWNIYAFHCSDGDNFYSDNDLALDLASKLSDVCNLFGYGEIKPQGSAYYSGSMTDVFKKLSNTNFRSLVIEKKEDVWPALKGFLLSDANTTTLDGQDGDNR